MTVKIYVGNISIGTDPNQISELFKKYGNVTQCDILTGFAFVHMESEEDAAVAIKALDGHHLSGCRMNVEMSTASTQGRARIAARCTTTVKIFVGNLSKATTNEMLKELFETYGNVAEADVLSGFGFVHMNQEQEAYKAIKALNGYVLDGNRINVELSTGSTQGKSKERAECYLPPRGGPLMQSRGRMGSSRYDPYPHPPLPPLSSRRPSDAYDMYGNPSGRGSTDSFARDLLELYIKNRAAFDAYANDPLVRKALNLPPVESDASYYRSPPQSSSSRDFYDRRRSPSMTGADPYASPSDYAPFDSMTSAAGRSWSGASSSGYGGPIADHPLPPSASAAKGKGHLYTSFE